MTLLHDYCPLICKAEETHQNKLRQVGAGFFFINKVNLRLYIRGVKLESNAVDGQEDKLG